MSDRKQREKHFHNQVFSDRRRASLSNFYGLQEARESFFQDMIEESCEGKKVLEYGCGPGGYAFSLAKAGANVVGIDLSEVAIEQAMEIARRENLEKSPEFLVMDAENLKFKDGSFDIVCGGAIIHHLDTERALSEVSRVLKKPGGKAVFLEPLGYNPAINIFRRFTPDLRTKDEHPLKSEDLAAAKRYFGTVKTYHFDLLTLLALPFAVTPIFNGVLKFLRFLDMVVLNLPLVRWLSWAVVIELSEPKFPPKR